MKLDDLRKNKDTDKYANWQCCGNSGGVDSGSSTDSGSTDYSTVGTNPEEHGWLYNLTHGDKTELTDQQKENRQQNTGKVLDLLGNVLNIFDGDDEVPTDVDTATYVPPKNDNILGMPKGLAIGIGLLIVVGGTIMIVKKSGGKSKK